MQSTWKRLAKCAAALAVLSVGVQHADAWDVRHRIRWRPGGNVVPQVEWRHREYALSRQAAPPLVDLCDPGQIIVPNPPLGLSSSFPVCQTSVGSTFANGYASLNLITLTAVPNPLIEAEVRSWGNVRAKVDRPPFTSARAIAMSESILRARGGRRLADGTIRWQKNWRASGVRGGAGRIIDPIIIRATPLAGGPAIETTLISIKGHVTKGTIAWMNNTLTLMAGRPGIPGGPPAHARVDVVMNSPYTVEQGTLRIEVRDGVVIFSEATGIWGTVPVPPPGAFVGDILALPVPDETTINYNLNLPPGDFDVEGAAQIGGREEDTDAASWVCPPAITDLGEGFNLADVSIVAPGSIIFGYSIAAPQISIAFPVHVPEGEVWIPEGITALFYQTGGGPSGPIGIACRLWQGNPMAGGFPIAGDLTTNRYAADSPEAAYRVVSTDRLNQQRLLRTVTGRLDDFPMLQSFFDVWFEITLIGDPRFPGPFTPPSIPFPASQPQTPPMIQYNAATQQWTPLLDAGLPANIQVALHARRIIRCPADLNRDGVVDFNDLLEYLNLYNQPC